MSKWSDILFGKVQTLLGERGTQRDHAVRFRDLDQAVRAVSNLSASDPRIETLIDQNEQTATALDELDVVLAAADLERQQIALDAAAADTKAQAVRDDHDGLVVDFIGTLANRFADVDTAVAGTDAQIDAVSANLTTNYLTSTQTAGAIAAGIDAFETEFRDPATGQIRATALTGYYTASGTDGAISAARTELEGSISAVERSLQGFQYITDAAEKVTAGAAVTVTTGASVLGQAGTIIVAEGATARVTSGPTNGARLTIPMERAILFSGQRVKIGVLARRPATNFATRFGIAYSPDELADSGYIEAGADLVDTWQWFTFFYTVPQAVAGGVDYISLFGDNAKSGKATEIARVYVEIAAVAGDLPEINNLSGQVTDILALNISPDTALASTITAISAQAADAEAAVVAQGTAIADLEGAASAGYLIRAQAGGAVSLIDLVAADDGVSTPTSVVRIAAENILLDGSVTATTLAANSVTAEKINAGAITADKINVTSLSAISASIGTLSSAVTGERVVIEDDRISVYDAADNLRVRIGRL